jgi:hypothetical protein
MSTPQTTPEQIAAKLRDRADRLLAPLRLEIEMQFRDPEYQKIIWIAVRELVEDEIE